MRIRFSLLLILIVFTSAVLAVPPQRLFILLGQSNMPGRATIEPEDTLPLPLVQLLNNQGIFEKAQNPLNRYSNIRKDISMQKLGPGYTFADTVATWLQDTIFIIVNAWGSTAIERFMKNDSQYSFPVFDGFPVRMDQVKIFPVVDMEAIY